MATFQEKVAKLVTEPTSICLQVGFTGGVGESDRIRLALPSLIVVPNEAYPAFWKKWNLTSGPGQPMRCREQYDSPDVDLKIDLGESDSPISQLGLEKTLYWRIWCMAVSKYHSQRVKLFQAEEDGHSPLRFPWKGLYLQGHSVFVNHVSFTPECLVDALTGMVALLSDDDLIRFALSRIREDDAEVDAVIDGLIRVRDSLTTRGENRQRIDRAVGLLRQRFSPTSRAQDAVSAAFSLSRPE